jgi:hypothetical protein
MTKFNDVTNQTISRLMNLQEYTVAVDVEHGWLPNGPVPFDIFIKDGVAQVTLPALSLAEAQQKAREYFQSDDLIE